MWLFIVSILLQEIPRYNICSRTFIGFCSYKGLVYLMKYTIVSRFQETFTMQLQCENVIGYQKSNLAGRFFLSLKGEVRFCKVVWKNCNQRSNEHTWLCFLNSSYGISYIWAVYYARNLLKNCIAVFSYFCLIFHKCIPVLIKTGIYRKAFKFCKRKGSGMVYNWNWNCVDT